MALTSGDESTAAAPFRALSDDEARATSASAYAAIVGQRSVGMTDLYRLLMHAPDVAVGWCGLGTAVRERTTLEPGLRELLICFVALRTGSAYELAAHVPLAQRFGVAADHLDALADWPNSPTVFAERSVAALDLVECVLEARFDPRRMATARQHFDEQAILEIAAIAAYYLSVSSLIQGIGFDEGLPR